MSYKEDEKHQYTMINKDHDEEWNAPNGETVLNRETVLNFDNPNNMGKLNNVTYDDSYDITRLDYAWFPILKKSLQNGNLSQRSQDGVPLVRVTSDADDTVDYVPSSDRPLSSFDEIDARGSFNAQELERDLRQMQRHELGKSIDALR